MPKIKVKQTPTQARILRALAQNNGLFIGWIGRGAWWSGTNDAKVKRELGNPRVATMRKLSAEGWIEKVADQDVYWTVTSYGASRLDDLDPEDYISKIPNITAGEIVEILRAKVFPEPFWMMVTELAVDERRIDAWALKVSTGSLFPSKKTPGITGAKLLTSWSLEIKTSRSDFLSEIQYPRKRENAMQICNRFAFVAPVGIIPKDELPAGCGLLEIHSDRHIEMTIEPPYEIADRPTWKLVAAIARAMMK